MAGPDPDGALATETVGTGGGGEPIGLTVVCHPDAGRLGSSVRLERGMTLALGRKSTELGDGVLADGSVSRNHAIVTVSDGGALEVSDAGSHNGTLVNGATISTAALGAGDIVRLGRIALLVDDDPPEGEPVEPLPGFAGSSGTWQRLTRVAAVLSTRRTPVLVWGPEGSGCRALAQAIAEPGAVVVLREPPEAWPRQGTAIVTQLDRWDEDALRRHLGEVDGARPIVVAHHAPEALDQLPESFRSAVVPWALAVPPLASRRVDVASIVWELCRRFAGPDARPTVELVERLVRMPLALDARALEAIVERAAIESAGPEIDVFVGLDTQGAPRVQPEVGPTVSIARDGTWCRVGDGARVDLGGRKLLQRLVVALGDAAQNRPGEAMGVDALFAAGWPGDRTSGRARTNRVYVALTRLRQAGLQDVLVRNDVGYRFDPSCSVRWVEASS